MIKFVWLGLVCCGVANGAIFLHVAPPQKYIYMGSVLLICFILVGIHRHFTNHLIEENRDYDEDHIPIFIASTMTTIVVALIALIAGATAVSVGLLTAGVGFIFASVRESMYT